MYYVRESDKDEFQTKLLELFKEYNASIQIEFDGRYVKGISIHIMGECGHGWEAFSVAKCSASADELEESTNRNNEEETC